MSQLPDGTIVPSFLGVQGTGMRRNPGNQTDVGLRWGTVKELVYPNDPRNSSQKYIEYLLSVEHKDGGKPGANVNYLGVQLSNLFGGVADYLNYTLRPTPQQSNPQPGKLLQGSKVLCLCVNGDRAQAIIIGGARDGTYDGNVDDNGQKGHNLDFSFNGLNATVNDDGELTVVFNGKTDIDGTLADSADPDAQGSNIRMTKDGSVLISSPDALQHVLIDNTNHLVEIDADQELDINVTGNLVIQSAGVLTGGATDATMRGTTYRMNETIMNSTLEALCTALNTALQAASTTVSTAGAQLTASGTAVATAGATLGTPTIGPTLAAPQLAAAGTTLGGAGAALTAASAALAAAAAAFEAWNAALTLFEQTDELTPYISDVNFSD